MSTTCYALLRGSSLRVTGLDASGRFTEPLRRAVSRSAVKITIDEVTDSRSDEVLRDETDRARLNLRGSEESIGYTIDADFLRVDPGLLSLMIGVPVVLDASGDVVGFDADTRLPAQSFGLEVWSRLGVKDRWGYTLFPFLRGGYLSGFTFGDGLVSFNMRKAHTRRGSGWAVGPYDIEGPHQRLITPVSRNDAWRSVVTTLPPPEQGDGIVEFEDIIYGGNASYTSPDILAGGSAGATSPWIVNGGRA